MAHGRPLRVSVFLRPDHGSVPGGDLVQLRSTAQALQQRGLEVTISSDSAQVGGDIVHLFNYPSPREAVEVAVRARAHNVPVAVSTVYWPKSEHRVANSASLITRTAATVLGRRRAASLYEHLRRDAADAIEAELFMRADLLLPNSAAEWQMLTRRYRHLTATPHACVPNAIDVARFGVGGSADRRTGVLSVGRIETRKNTLALIRACGRLGLPLTLVGAVTTGDTYAEACLRALETIGGSYVGHVDQEQLIALYQLWAVHALVSWYETPGLASLEAAACGSAIVSTNRGSAHEYFGPLAQYCNPASVRSIEGAITAALEQPRPDLREQVVRYTWDAAAAATDRAYRRVVPSS